jgi:hypothetical protein
MVTSVVTLIKPLVINSEGGKNIIIIIIITIITRCYQIIQSCKRSQPVNPNNTTTTNTLSAAVITVSVDVQILPTGEEFGGRGGHFSIMQYPDKGHRR